MVNWQEEIGQARESSHRFYILADNYMNATGRSGNGTVREKFDRLLFKTILDGIPNFEQIWRVITILYGDSPVTRKSVFSPMLFRRALELANDTSAVRAIIDSYYCSPATRRRAEAKLLKLESEDNEEFLEDLVSEIECED